jgi:proteasome accessory factor A
MSLEVWQGAEQEFAAGSQPVGLFQALGGRGVYVYRPLDNIPRAHLRNGGVCYIHSNLFEVCTPECRGPRALVAYDKASEAYARLASWAHEEETGQRVHLYKTNIASDPKGEVEHTTVGAHENYLVKREGYADAAPLLIPFLVLRQLFCGVGGYVRGEFMVSPRSIFPLKVYSEVSTDYPIVSLRDEPHAGEAYTRAHIVFGEGARSEYTTFLKHSATSLVLQAIQGGYVKRVPELADPIEAGKELAGNLDGDWSVKLAGGERLGAVDFLSSYYVDGIESLLEEDEPSQDSVNALSELKWVLGKLGEGLIEDLDKSVEWVIKKTLVEDGYQENFRHEEGMDEASAKEAAAFQYTAVTDPLFDELSERHGLRTIVTQDEVERAFFEPPTDSRAMLRVALARHLEGSLETLSWSFLKYREGRKRLTYGFESLDGWTDERVAWAVKDLDSRISGL